MTIHQPIVSPGCACDRQDIISSLISLDEALARIAAHATPVGRAEAVSLDIADGRVLAHPVRCRCAAPSFDNAAMDGYAVATSALTGSGPWVLPVVARFPAGREAMTSLAGAEAARIFTGCPDPSWRGCRGNAGRRRA